MSWHQWIAAWRLLRFSSSIVPHLLTGIVDPVIFCKVNHTRRVLYGKLFNVTPKASLQNISPWKSPWSQLYQNFFANFKSGLSTRGPTSLDSWQQEGQQNKRQDLCILTDPVYSTENISTWNFVKASAGRKFQWLQPDHLKSEPHIVRAVERELPTLGEHWGRSCSSISTDCSSSVL